MPFDMRAALDWLYEEGTNQVFGPKEAAIRWLYGDVNVPRNTYRKVLFVIGDVPGLELTAPENRTTIMEGLSKRAAEGGFRLLRLIPTNLVVPQFEGANHVVFSAYAASDFTPLPLKLLSDSLFGAPIIMSSEDVGISERASLDAVWAAHGAGKDFIGDVDDIKPTITHKVNVWPLIGAGILLTAGIAGVWALFGGKKR